MARSPGAGFGHVSGEAHFQVDDRRVMGDQSVDKLLLISRVIACLYDPAGQGVLAVIGSERAFVGPAAQTTGRQSRVVITEALSIPVT